MRTMCGCSERSFENCDCDRIVWRKRCICWCEPVRIRRRCLCNPEQPRPKPRPRPDRCLCHIEGISIQLTTIDDKHLPSGKPVIFNEILTDNSRFMSYDHETGVIEIFKHGNYLIDWDIVVEGSSQEPKVSFGIEVNGEVKASSTLPVTVGQLSGQALIHVDQIQTTVRLINDTGETVQLSKFTPIANLRIVSVE